MTKIDVAWLEAFDKDLLSLLPSTRAMPAWIST